VKKCSKCKKVKNKSEFTKRKDSKCGVVSACKMCHKLISIEYRKQNHERILKSSREWRYRNKDNKLYKLKNLESSNSYYSKNKEKCNYRSKCYRDNNKEKLASYDKKYRENNKDIKNSICAKRMAKKKSSTFINTNYEKEQIRLLYKLSSVLSEETGIKHHVDHILPIQGKLICGFHCLNNLQVITQKENSKKSNKYKLLELSIFPFCIINTTITL